MRLMLCISLWLVWANLFGNDSLQIEVLLRRIQQKQVVHNNFFVAGSFASFRQHANDEKLLADNNVFYTALVAYTLQQLKPKLKLQQNIIADSIIEKSKRSFTSYKNIKGRNTYNFWTTTNGKDFFPNQPMLSHFKKQLALADDLDDTGIILSVLNISDSTAQQAHSLMQQHANGSFKWIKTTKKKYQKIPAYSTWYGVKMPVDFDFAVHCNILAFVNKYNLKWSKTDSATYNLLLHIIDAREYITDASNVSPYYADAAVLLYHIARLYSVKTLEGLAERKPKLIEDANKLLVTTNNKMHQVLIATSLLKLKSKAPVINIDEEVMHQTLNTTNFVYYTGHLFAHYNNPIKFVANLFKQTEFKWYCSAFNDCLLLEYLVMRGAASN